MASAQLRTAQAACRLRLWSKCAKAADKGLQQLLLSQATTNTNTRNNAVDEMRKDHQRATGSLLKDCHAGTAPGAILQFGGESTPLQKGVPTEMSWQCC